MSGPSGSGFSSGTQPPEAVARLNSGGYLWVHRSGFSVVATLFDSALAFISETQISNTPAEALAIADVNGDGSPDILIGTPFAHNNALQVLLGTGGSNFQAAVTYPIPSSPFGVEQLEVLDLDGDGKPDALIVNSGKLSVFYGNGDGTFQAERTPFTGACSAAAIGDFNGDGRLDIACTSEHTTLVVELGAGGGAFGPPTTYAVAWRDSIAAADLDGDGNLDLVASGYTDPLRRWHRPVSTPRRLSGRRRPAGSSWQISMAMAKWTSSPEWVRPRGSWARRFPCCSIAAEATVGGPPVTLVQGLPAGNDSVNGLSPADFDGDGIPDLLAQDLFEIGVLKSIGDGAFSQTC